MVPPAKPAGSIPHTAVRRGLVYGDSFKVTKPPIDLLNTMINTPSEPNNILKIERIHYCLFFIRN